MSRKIEDEHKSMVFVALVDYIGKEAYRAAVLSQYHDEYNNIRALYDTIVSQLKPIFVDEGPFSSLDDLSYSMTNAIVLSSTLEEIHMDIESIVYRSLPDDMLEEDCVIKAKLQDELKQITKAATDIYHDHANWCTDIYHKCMPVDLVNDADPKQVLDYVENKGYRIITVESKKGARRVINTLPFNHGRMFADNPRQHFKVSRSESIPIPEASIFHKYYQSPTLPKEKLSPTMSQLEALAQMEYVNIGVTDVDFVDELSVHIDLSSPMSQREFELLVSSLHQQIQIHQGNNKLAATLLAKNLEDLDRFNQAEDIGRFDLANHMTLTQRPIPGVNTFADIRRALLGLIAWHTHFIKQKEYNRLEYRKSEVDLMETFEKLAAELIADATEKKKGCSANTIKNGYDVISAAIQKELSVQRRGRYQNRRMSASRKSDLEGAPKLSIHSLHANDKAAVQKRINRLKERGRTGAIKQHEDGSIWVTF